MKIIPFIFLILGSLLEIIDAIRSVLSIFTAEFISITSIIIQVLFFLLAIIFSLINIFSNQEKTVYFFITVLSLALFIARVGWLVNWLN